MSKPIGTEGLRLIKEFEGCRLTAYKCPAGVWTIAYGRTNGVHEGMTITQEQAEQFLIEDCQLYANYVDNALYVPFTKSLNSNQRDALISFAYNCGAGNLRNLCKGRTLEQISTAMLLYNKANGKPLAGLIRRREAEQSLFNKPVVSTTKNESEVDYDMPLIKEGSKGKAVKVWQVILGFSRTDCDGIFGVATEKATKEFQKKHKLVVDGIVGKNTWKAGIDSI